MTIYKKEHILDSRLSYGFTIVAAKCEKERKTVIVESFRGIADAFGCSGCSKRKDKFFTCSDKPEPNLTIVLKHESEPKPEITSEEMVDDIIFQLYLDEALASEAKV